MIIINFYRSNGLGQFVSDYLMFEGASVRRMSEFKILVGQVHLFLSSFQSILNFIVSRLGVIKILTLICDKIFSPDLRFAWVLTRKDFYIFLQVCCRIGQKIHSDLSIFHKILIFLEKGFHEKLLIWSIIWEHKTKIFYTAFIFEYILVVCELHYLIIIDATGSKKILILFLVVKLTLNSRFF